MNDPKYRQKKLSTLFCLLIFAVALAALFAFFISVRNTQTPPQSSGKDIYNAHIAAAWDTSGDTGGNRRKKHRSLWDKLFGPFEYEQQPPAKNSNRQRPPASVQSQPSPPAGPVKNANARRILVAGDFLAASLAEGLSAAYADNADIVIRNRSRANSGLNRLDVYDWAGVLPALIAQERPSIVIIMLGANDRQALRLGTGAQADFGTPAWRQNYQSHINTLAQALQKSGIPWLWIALPPFKQDNLTAAAADFNRLYKQAAEQAGGNFIDIWSGFVDIQGNFAFSGYDNKGQIARLRSNDGINFTFAGKRKLAFYPEQIVTLLLGALAEQPSSADTNPDSVLHKDYIAPINPLDIGASSSLSLAGTPTEYVPINAPPAAVGIAPPAVFSPLPLQLPALKQPNPLQSAPPPLTAPPQEQQNTTQMYRGRADDFTRQTAP